MTFAPPTNVPLRKDRAGDIRNCPVCGFPVRVVRRDGGYADKYAPMVYEKLEESLPSESPEIAKKLRELRKGKKTVAIVGMAPSTCSLAPWEDKTCEIWALNEMHAFPWVKRITRLFQMHPRWSFTREVAVRNVKGHFDWLQQKHGFPIYMQFKHDDIPDSVEYPLHEVKALLGNLWKGDAHPSYWTSTFVYMIALAVLEKFERIEIYGFEMAGMDEYGPQKACGEAWIFYALGHGIEVYLPKVCQMISGPLYGYEGMGPRNIVP